MDKKALNKFGKTSMKGWRLVKARLSETARLAFLFASPRLFYLIKCETEINSHFNLTSAEKSRLRDPRNYTKILRESCGLSQAALRLI